MHHMVSEATPANKVNPRRDELNKEPTAEKRKKMTRSHARGKVADCSCIACVYARTRGCDDTETS